MKQIRAGLVAMLVSFALSAVVALGTLVSTGGLVNGSTMTGDRIASPTLLLALLTPWAIIGEIVAVRSGSLSVLRAGQAVKAGAAILQYSVPFFLAFAVAGPWSRKALWAALGLVVVGNFATVILGASTMGLEPLARSGIVSYAPTFSVDHSRGFYPVLLVLGYSGMLLYIAAYVCLLVRLRPARGSGIHGR
ncbi:MAG: hypothetical protein JXB46_11350 [Candidatus Eisenbacteria bacterium]|nr:hypothetical protein [Candidatus Eisenbacteria bacterium]